MKQLQVTFLLFLAGLFLCSNSLWAQTATAQYVGAAKCKMCHMGAKKGDQFAKWQASQHSKAFATLATEKAKEVAKKAGVEGDPQQSPKCLKCHVTGFEAPASAKAASYAQTDGVGCEACHGAGSAYQTMKVMKALRAGTQEAKAVGFLKGDEATCIKCHNPESPTYKPF